MSNNDFIHTKTRNVHIIGIVTALCSFLSFSLLDTLVKIYSQWYDVITLSYLIRVSVILSSFLYLVCISIVKKSMRYFRTESFHVHVIRGFLLFFITMAFTYTFRSLKLSTAYSIIFMLPIVTALFASLTIKEHIPLLIWGAIFFGFIGMLIVLRPGIAPWNWGYITALLGITLEAPFFIMIRKFHAKEHAITIMFYPQITATLLYVILFSVIRTIDLQFVHSIHIWGLILMGLLNISAQVCMAYSLKKNDTNISTSMQYSQVVWGLLLGYFVFGNTPDNVFFFVLGTTLIIISGYVVSTGRIPFTKKSR